MNQKRPVRRPGLKAWHLVWLYNSPQEHRDGNKKIKQCFVYGVWDTLHQIPEKLWGFSELRAYQAVGTELPGWGVIVQGTPQHTSSPTWNLVSSSHHHQKDLCFSSRNTSSCSHGTSAWPKLFYFSVRTSQRSSSSGMISPESPFAILGLGLLTYKMESWTHWFRRFLLIQKWNNHRQFWIPNPKKLAFGCPQSELWVLQTNVFLFGPISQFYLGGHRETNRLLN